MAPHTVIIQLNSIMNLVEMKNEEIHMVDICGLIEQLKMLAWLARLLQNSLFNVLMAMDTGGVVGCADRRKRLEKIFSLRGVDYR